MLLAEFNLMREVVDFNPITSLFRKIDHNDVPENAHRYDTPFSDTPIRGSFADIGGMRVFKYRTDDLKHVFLQTEDGFRIELNDEITAEINDKQSAENQVLREFRILTKSTFQTRYIAVYDALPILQGFWQDFTPFVEYKQWDFYAHLYDILQQIQEEGMPDWYEGPAPDDYFERLAQPLAADPQRIPAGQVVPQAGYWFTPSQINSRRYFKQGDIAPAVNSDYGEVLWLWDKNQSLPSMS